MKPIIELTADEIERRKKRGEELTKKSYKPLLDCQLAEEDRYRVQLHTSHGLTPETYDEIKKDGFGIPEPHWSEKKPPLFDRDKRLKELDEKEES